MLDLAKLGPAAEAALGACFEFRGKSPVSGFDCLGLVAWIYAQADHPLKYDEPEDYPQEWWPMRPSLFIDGLRRHATMIPVTALLRPGDIVMFAIGSQMVTHVGVLLGGDEFVHCFLGRGVIKSRLSQAYWRGYFVGAARVLAAQPTGKVDGRE